MDSNFDVSEAKHQTCQLFCGMFVSDQSTSLLIDLLSTCEEKSLCGLIESYINWIQTLNTIIIIYQINRDGFLNWNELKKKYFYNLLLIYTLYNIIRMFFTR